jgi:nitrile hydratase beta subunit
VSQAAHAADADLGGTRGHGRIVPEPEGELWHAAWEPRALALTLAMGATGQWNIDASRAARESLPSYLRLGYYEIWMAALCRLLAERGLVGADELAAGRALHPARPLRSVLRAADVAAVLARGSPTARSAAAGPRFAVGERVRTWAGEVPHHTRLPRYARGRVGTVVAHHGAHVFADAHATGRGEMPQHLYTIAFDGRELWPDVADRAEAAALVVSIDAWEPYLAPAATGAAAGGGCARVEAP